MLRALMMVLVLMLALAATAGARTVRVPERFGAAIPSATAIDDVTALVAPQKELRDVELERDVLAQAGFPLRVSPDLALMDPRLFRPEPMGLELQPARRRWSPS